MSATPLTPTGVKVVRSTRASWAGLVVAALLLMVLAMLPYVVGRGLQQNLVILFSLIVLGTMWNLLAGYGGMVSIGQQAYIGLGAYGLVVIADVIGLDPFVAIALAVVFAGVVSLPISFLAFRLSGGYFAIGTWVIAEVIRLIVVQLEVVGEGSGVSFQAMAETLTPGRRIAYVYWLGLASVVIAVAVTYLLMRSRLGLGFTAIRDDATAAGSLGVPVVRSRRIVFVVSAMGCALAGVVIAANTLRVEPESVFGVQWAAYMIFIVVIGGIGTIEGPIIGAVIFFGLQQWLSDLGTWYLVIIGVVAIVVTLFLPKGIWGLISGSGRIKLFPVGYTVKNPLEKYSIAGRRAADAQDGSR